MNKIVLALIFYYTLIVSNAFAITSSQENSARRSVEINQQRLERERVDIIKEKGKNEVKKIRDSKNLDDLHKDDKVLDGVGECTNLNKITIKGNTVFSTKWLERKALKKYKDKCLSRVDLIKAKQDLENLYIVKGYSNARVYFDKEKLKTGSLSLFILEGRIEKINLENNSKIDEKLTIRKPSKLFMAFPFKKGKIFNIRDFEQGLDQINRLQSSNATMKSEPGIQGGSSNIIIENKIEHPTNLSIAYDNSGQESSGKKKRKFTISQDNLLGLYDNFYLNYTKDDELRQRDKFTKSIYSSFSIPYGYWTFLASYSESEYLTTINELNTKYTVSGQTLSKTFQLDRVVARGKRFKAKFGAELSVKDTASFIVDTIIDNSTNKLSILSIFNENTIYTKSGTIFIKPSYIKGLDILDARSDLNDITTNEAHAQYQAEKLYAYYNTNFNIPKTKTPLNYLLTLDSQLSQNTLYGTEKFSIGGRYSVRGFDENSISGDNGYYVRNDLKINTSHLFPNKLLNSRLFTFQKSRGLSLSNVLSKTSLGVFYDYGYVRNKNIISDAGKGYMSGAGVKLDYMGRYLDWNLTFSKGLRSPKFIQNIYGQAEDEDTLYFNISTKLGLF